mgnify:CR=1 FL=1
MPNAVHCQTGGFPGPAGLPPEPGAPSLLQLIASGASTHVAEGTFATVDGRVLPVEFSASPLIENDVFPPMVAQMVKIGEETGELEKMLGKIADFYEDEVDASIQSLTSIVEPIMMLGVGILSVLFINQQRDRKRLGLDV